jgi:uncharacterized protein YecE (DUF72 family)
MGLEHWAVKLRHHPDADAIYLFANNHYEGMAVETIQRLAAKLGIPLPPVQARAGQLELFGAAKES